MRPDLAPVIRGSRAVRERVRGQAMKSSITLRMEETHSSVGKATTGPLSGSTSASHVREGDDAGSHSDSPRARRKKCVAAGHPVLWLPAVRGWYCGVAVSPRCTIADT